jgi:hypothetical protein
MLFIKFGIWVQLLVRLFKMEWRGLELLLKFFRSKAVLLMHMDKNTMALMMMKIKLMILCRIGFKSPVK